MASLSTLVYGIQQVHYNDYCRKACLLAYMCMPGRKGPNKIAVSVSLGWYNAVTHGCIRVIGRSTSGHAQNRGTCGFRQSKKSTAMAFRRWSKLVAGDTQGHWSLVAEGSNMHRIEALSSSITPEANGLGWYHAIRRVKFRGKPCIFDNESCKCVVLSISVATCT